MPIILALVPLQQFPTSLNLFKWKCPLQKECKWPCPLKDEIPGLQDTYTLRPLIVIPADAQEVWFWISSKPKLLPRNLFVYKGDQTVSTFHKLETLIHVHVFTQLIALF